MGFSNVFFCNLGLGGWKGEGWRGAGESWGGVGEGLGRGLGSGWGGVWEGLGRAWLSMLQQPRLKDPVNIP